MSQVTIELARIDKPARIYHKGFLSDYGIELRTLTQLSQEISRNYSRIWQVAGALAKDQLIATF
jgi:hypothetical protein